jgi:hypothetical protein
VQRAAQHRFDGNGGGLDRDDHWRAAGRATLQDFLNKRVPVRVAWAVLE